MPNWVDNTLTVEGNPESVIKLKNQLNTPFKRNHDQWNPETGNMEVKEYAYDNPIFSFWNVIKPTNMAVYDLQKDPNEDPKKLFSGDNWYDWNNRNWGTKWDVAVSNDTKYAETELLHDEANGENHVLVYRYNTAWSPATPVLEILSAQYPDLLLTLNYEEETGWGGEDEFVNGEHIEGASWNWACRECDYKETNEPPYCETCDFDMCPSCGWGEPMDEDREKCEIHHTVIA